MTLGIAAAIALGAAPARVRWPLDAWTFLGISGLLFLVGLVAAYLPARKAASISPIEAMRTE